MPFICWNAYLVGWTVDVLKPTNVDKLPNDLEGMEATMERLLALIDDVYKYVDDVVVSKLIVCSWISYLLSMFIILTLNILPFQEGRSAPDNKIGRYISDTIAALPKLSPNAFDKLVNDSLQVWKSYPPNA